MTHTITFQTKWLWLLCPAYSQLTVLRSVTAGSFSVHVHMHRGLPRTTVVLPFPNLVYVYYNRLNRPKVRLGMLPTEVYSISMVLDARAPFPQLFFLLLLSSCSCLGGRALSSVAFDSPSLSLRVWLSVWCLVSAVAKLPSRLRFPDLSVSFFPSIAGKHVIYLVCRLHSFATTNPQPSPFPADARLHRNATLLLSLSGVLILCILVPPCRPPPPTDCITSPRKEEIYCYPTWNHRIECFGHGGDRTR